MVDAGPRLGLAPNSANADAKTKSAAFEQWLVNNNMYLSKKATWGEAKHGLAIADETTDEGEPSGRGLVAVKPIIQGELLFKVPLECVITKEKALSTFPGLPDDLDDYLAIAVLIIHERSLGEASFWKPYFDILPADEEFIPLFRWGEGELDLLKGSPTLAAAQSLSGKLRSEFDALETSLFANDRDRFPKEVFTRSAWEWAFAVLFSRGIMLSSEKTVALVPYADLLNHNPFCSTYIDIGKSMMTGDRFVTLYTDRPYSKMAQVFVTYGPKSNAELLLQYGFVVDRNPYDSVDVTVSLPASDPLYAEKRQYLLESGVQPSTKFPLYRDRYPMEMIEFLRFCVADAEEMESADFGDFVGERNETLVADALVEACKSAIEAYPTTIEEDEKLVKDRKMYRLFDTKTRCAIRQRLAEKRILQRTMVNIQQEMIEGTFLFKTSGE